MNILHGMACAFRSMGRKFAVAAVACCALILTCAGSSQAQQAPRRPQGVYAHVSLPSLINHFYKTHGGAGEPSCPPATTSDQNFLQDLHNYIDGIYADVLKNTAISGIVAGMPWCLLEPTKGSFDWSWLNDVFLQAQAARKNVQLHITPGVDSPSWLVDPATNPSCDPVIENQGPLPDYQDCGWVTFSKLPEKMVFEESDVLPLPWSVAYTAAWKTFLRALNMQFFAENPKFVPLFVAIAVAGPVSTSTEMILPTTVNKSQYKYKTTLDVDTGWKYLVDNSFPPLNTDEYYYNIWNQAFVDSWSRTISAYESAFSGVTLILIPDDGGNMPQLSVGGGNPTGLIGPDCTGEALDLQPLSCAAKAIVISDFVGAEGANAKATMVGGLQASNSIYTGFISLPGVKLLTSRPAAAPQSAILGGAQFDFRVSGDNDLRVEEGCVCAPELACTQKTCMLNPDTPEQAAYNVLANFFYGTIAAGHYDHQTVPPNPSPLHFLIFAQPDVVYAKTHPCMQQLLAQASADLLATAGKAPLGPLKLDACPANIGQ